MTSPFILPLASCEDRALVGGKAAGLGRLIRHGFRVPPGVCLTTRAYHEILEQAGLRATRWWEEARETAGTGRQARLEEWRRQIRALALPVSLLDELRDALRGIPRNGPTTLWAVRSSATHEDDHDRTGAGLYQTQLGVQNSALAAAIRDCWASLWSDAAVAHHERMPKRTGMPGMAVIIQPLLSPHASGVAYSHHPITHDREQVVVNAVPGLAEAFVSGWVTPDSFLVHIGETPKSPRILEVQIAEKSTLILPTDTGIEVIAVPAHDRRKPAVSDEEIVALSRLTKSIEQALAYPVDVEWAIDDAGIWLLQARPIATGRAEAAPTDGTSAWSRANFKETLPELPSPLGLSLLADFMDRNIIRHYDALGCDIPPGLSCVRIIEGRPFINVSLLQLVVAQLGGDPALIAEQVGGRLPAPPRATRLVWWKLLRAALLAARAMRHASKRAPTWFSEMRRMAEDHTRDRITGLQPIELFDRLDRVGQRLAEGDLTFAIVSGVSQGLHSLRWLLARRLGDEWRPALNASVQGSGTVISARQIFLVAELAEAARADPEARAFFANETWEPGQYRLKLAGSAFLEGFERYLAEYGHRAIGESDVMSPRFEENPSYILDIIRGHLLAKSSTPTDAVQHRQAATRADALARIEASFGWRWHERILFRWWHRELCRYLALREANRHHLMHFTSAVRRLLLALGAVLAADGTLESKEDVFFFTIEEFRGLSRGARRDWKALVYARRAERERHAARTVPDFVGGIPLGKHATDKPLRGLVGLPISSGYAEGKARPIRSPADFAKVERGDILVVSVIDPGLAPLFGLAGGLIAEMGGILSHGAIIAREYGIPAVVNIPGITGLLTDSDRVAVDGATGEIRLLSRAG